MSRRPETRYEMRRAMYKLMGTSTCKGCAAPIEWWETTSGKKLPVNVQPAGDDVTVVAHFITCPKAAEFRRRDQPAAAAGPVETDAARRERLVATLRHATGARAIVAIYDDLTTFSYQEGVPGEDLRNDLIGAANVVRNHVQERER